MRRFIARSSFFLVVVSSAAAAATYVTCPGCIDRDLVNAACEWPGHTGFPIDQQNPTHQQHLVRDAQLAEDLAVRYADAQHKRLFGYEGHGGLIDSGRLLNGCLARLQTIIENDHSVTADQVRMARGQRNPRFDLAVALSFVPLYCLAGIVVCLSLVGRFLSDGLRVVAAAAGLTSVPASLLGLHLGQLWVMAWETVRVKNGHIGGYRLASYQHPWLPHVVGLFIFGVVLFWLMAWLCYWAMREDARTSTNLRRSPAILLQ